MIIKGEKIILRPVKLSDAPIFVRLFRDQKVIELLNQDRKNLQEERRWIRGLAKNEKGNYFTIETKAGEIIGNIALVLNSKLNNKNAFLWVVIGVKNWGKGYGTEAIILILNYGFKKLKLNRVELNVVSFNPRAIHIYKKLGFKLEGVKREHVFYRGKFHNSFLMGILRKEWGKIKYFNQVIKP